MPIKKIATWAILIFLAYYLFTKPANAAGAVHNVFNMLKTAGASLAQFLNSL